MPIIDYRCPNPQCQRDDSHYYPLASYPYPDRVPCPFCPSLMERNYMAGAPSVGFTPIVIHIRKDTGEVSIPGDPSDPLEKGYERIEITSMRAYEKFRRHVESHELEKAQFYQETSNRVFDDIVKEHRETRRAKIEQAIRRGGYEAEVVDENGVTHKRWAPISPRALKLYDLACKYTDEAREKRRRQLAQGRPNFHSRTLEHKDSEQSVVSGEAKRAQLFFRK